MKTGIQITDSRGPANQRILQCTFLSAAMLALQLTGCATIPPAPAEPRVEIPPAAPSGPSGKELIAQEDQSGQLVKFGKLRTVITSKETIIGKSGRAVVADEIRPLIEQELVDRDFRIFSGSVSPDSPVAEITRDTRSQLVITIRAKSEMVNSTGEFSKYRASAEAKAIRGHDGTILAEARAEAMGPRNQDGQRAGQLALREISGEISEQLVSRLLDKADQLMWAGLVINLVPTMDRAMEIQSAIEKKQFVSFVELLGWDKETQVATYEIIYGMKHESDIATLLRDIPHVSIRPSTYEPGSMEVLRKTMSSYK